MFSNKGKKIDQRKSEKISVRKNPDQAPQMINGRPLSQWGLVNVSRVGILPNNCTHVRAI